MMPFLSGIVATPSSIRATLAKDPTSVAMLKVIGDGERNTAAAVVSSATG